MKYQIISTIGLFLCACTAWAAIGSSDFSGQLIQDVRYRINSRGESEYKITFSVPFRFVRPAPNADPRSSDVFVQFALPERSKRSLPLEEVFTIKQPGSPIRSINFDGFNRNEPIVKIRFRRSVAHQVVQSGNDAISVVLSTPKVIGGAPKRLPSAKRTPPPKKTAKKPTIKIPAMKSGKTKLDKSISRLLSQGKNALARGDTAAAIRLFSLAVNKPGHSYHLDALELLGLAREREGRTDYAKRIYTQYLTIAKKGEGYDRVKQRLADIDVNVQIPKPLKKTTVSRNGFNNEMYGSLSVYQFSGEEKQDNVAAEKINTLQSLLNLTGRFRSNRYDIRTNAHGVFTNDATDNEEKFEANSLYMDLKDFSWGYHLKLGRQSGNNGGIFGRYDGVQLNYDLFSKMRLSGTYGYTVNYNEKDKIQTHMPFTAANIGFGTFFNYLDMTPYVFSQQINGIVNRKSAGLELRWGHPKFSLFNLVDYETEYQVVNLHLLNAVWRWSKRTNINFSFDDRKNPILQTQNALNNSAALASECGQVGNFTSIEIALQNGCTEDTIRRFVFDQKGESTFITLAFNHTRSDRFQINGDISRIETTTTLLEEKLDVVNEFERDKENADQYAVSMQFVFSRVFQRRDSNILGFRLVDDTAYQGISLSASNRLVFGRSWRLNSRLNTELRQYKPAETSDDYIRVRPSVRLDYSWKNKFEVQLEAAYDDFNYDGDTPDLNNYIITFGIRQDF